MILFTEEEILEILGQEEILEREEILEEENEEYY